MKPLPELRRFTPARVGLGRVGSSLPTSALLDFELAHARARDAVHAPFNVAAVEAELRALGFACLRAHSAARNRDEYLRRPDLGRRLAARELIPSSPNPELLFVVADGLSSLAAERHAVPLLAALLHSHLDGWNIGPVILAEQARVALGDEIGEMLRAQIVVMLIGERPGLSTPDSLGVYLTFDPRVGRSDAQRNCISNIHPAGLSYQLAAHRLAFLLASARTLRLTGTSLKDESNGSFLAPPSPGCTG